MDVNMDKWEIRERPEFTMRGANKSQVAEGYKFGSGRAQKQS